MKTLTVCPTYGRIPYLGRLLSSFISQTYDDKHLVIINDDKNVELCCNRKDVTILNCNQRMTVSEKRNVGIASGHYDIIFPLDDDDIIAPNRITNHLKEYEDPEVKGYRNLSAYIIYGDFFRKTEQSGHNSLSFRQKEWWRIGGYVGDYIYEDVEFHDKVIGLKLQNCDKTRDFVYHFGGVNYHLSCRPKEFSAFEELAYEQLQKLDLVGKKFWIEPDFEQYNNIMILKEMVDNNPEEIMVKHISDAKIDISHLF
jgi:glycosyltransferase involved in cell wall biosynthesis